MICYYHLEALDYDETKAYIKHRLEVSGRKDRELFSSEAVKEIYAYSNGIPRLINLIAHNALITGILYDADRISGEVVRETLEDLLHNNIGERRELALSIE